MVPKKTMPGYILVKMIYGDDIWHAVTRTQYITGFVGPKGRPICITDDEARKMGVDGGTNCFYPKHLSRFCSGRGRFF